ncbi:unnamed protein product [Brachionus calyciflorus]|uniref:SH3 domain-containing protein n=1 Tax=Brachionus calyciflorus TaxID=104777 RepID=A0A813Y3A5_9BILA|nr:unnamed protein product [Brachionus calyciflorus]
MSKQFTKLIEKAKSKFCNTNCTKDNQFFNESSYVPVTKVNCITPIRIKIDDQKNKKVLKKTNGRINLFKESNHNQQENEISMNISQFPMLTATPETTRVINHLQYKYIEETTENDIGSETSDYGSYSNELYESFTLSNNETRFSQMEQDSFGFNSSDFQQANSKMFQETDDDDVIESVVSELYVCRISFSASTERELTIEFSERLELISSTIHKHDNLCLVKNIQTQECGFVPKYSICKLSQFLSDMKLLN